MAQAAQKLVLDTGCEIALNLLVLSPTNVRRTNAETGIEELGEDIARRGLLHNLVVRPMLGPDGDDTGMYTVEAGGRRLRALQWLSRRRRLAKKAPIRCVILTDGVAEEDSLAENVQRAALHPLDQFRAFQALREKGKSEDDIAAAFFVTPQVVKQRLRLAAVSDKLLDAYAEDAMTLEQLMAFTVTPDKVRQEQVWRAVRNNWSSDPNQIRRMLTEKTVAASDRRARFVGLAAYEDAGGAVLRDLFADDDCGGWLQDAALLSRLVDEKLKALGESVAAEGWKWVEIAIDFPYGHTDDLRQLDGVPADLSKREKAKFEKLKTEFDQLNADYADAEELPEEVDARLGELEDLLAPFQSRPAIYAPEDMARAGAFISIGRDGAAVIERGFVRPDDEPANDAESADDTDAGEGEAGANGAAPRAAITLAGKSIDEEDDDDNGIKPLSDRLISELTAHRTLALRDALARNPRAAMTLLLHKLCSDAFLHGGQHGCLEASVHRVSLVAQSPDLKECASAKAIAERHDAWQGDVPEDDAALWAWLEALDDDSRAALLAHVVSFGVNAVQERANPYGGASADSLRRRIEQADRVARAVQLDMVESGWRPTIENYVGRVPKPRILEAVREAKGEQAAGLIDHLKKADMAREAERLLADTGWLPEPLRLDDLDAALPAFLAEETAPAPSRARSA